MKDRELNQLGSFCFLPSYVLIFLSSPTAFRCARPRLVADLWRAPSTCARALSRLPRMRFFCSFPTPSRSQPAICAYNHAHALFMPSNSSVCAFFAHSRPPSSFLTSDARLQIVHACVRDTFERTEAHICFETASFGSHSKVLCITVREDEKGRKKSKKKGGKDGRGRREEGNRREVLGRRRKMKRALIFFSF